LEITNVDKAAEYARYCEHCIQTARVLRRHEARTLHRETAAEWIRLAQRLAEDAAFAAQTIPKRRKARRGTR
jgi:hypothetical protein